MTTRAQIVREARTWIDTPWIHQASLRGVGCDCIGVVVGTAYALAMPEAKAWKTDAEFRGYGPTPVPEKLLAACAKYLDPIKLSHTLSGDVLLFAFKRQPMHFGILTNSNPRMMVHGFQRVGKVVENSLGEKWERRLFGAYRYRGLE